MKAAQHMRRAFAVYLDQRPGGSHLWDFTTQPVSGAATPTDANHPIPQSPERSIDRGLARTSLASKRRARADTVPAQAVQNRCLDVRHDLIRGPIRGGKGGEPKTNEY